MVTWRAAPGRAWPFAATGEVVLDGTRLRAKRGRRRWDIDLAAANARASRHHWGLARGVVIDLAANGTGIRIASEGFAGEATGLQAPIAGHPDLILAKPHFESLLAGLPAGLRERSAPDQSYWLWPNGSRMAAALRPALYGFAFVFTAAFTVRLTPPALAIASTITLLTGLLTLEARRLRRLRRPALRLRIAAPQIEVIDPATQSVLARCLVADLRASWRRWRQPYAGRGGAAQSPFDLPSVEIECNLNSPLSIGAATAWSGTSGPLCPPPRFLLTPDCWPAFARTLLPVDLPAPMATPENRENSDSPYRRS
jgi:hypothetical protein